MIAIRTAAQYRDSYAAIAPLNFAEEFEKEGFKLYSADSDKSLLRKIEIIGDQQSETLKSRIDESLASLNYQLQSTYTYA